MEYALIGGTGVEKLVLQAKSALAVNTPYGLIRLETGRIGDTEMVFLKRHGENHTTPPHAINYRGNIWALKEIGVQKILATGAVGSIVSEFKIGDIVLVDQFLDFTKSRPVTFYEGGERGVLHVDVSEPYCRALRRAMLEAGKELGLRIHDGGVYVCTEGPRFETPAEIRMFRLMGGQVVGMTGVPEVVLARELGMCYASMALVTNQAAGISEQPLTHAEVIATMNMLGEAIAGLVEKTCRNPGTAQRCRCSAANSEQVYFRKADTMMKSVSGKGSFALLDQTKLPFEQPYREARSYIEVAEAIRNMEVRGAPAIGAAAAYGFALGALKYEGEKDVFPEYMNQVLTTLESTRPTAVNLTWALRKMEAKLREVQSQDLAEIKGALVSEANAIAEEDRRMNRLIGEYGNTVVPEKANILTHCNAGSLATVEYGTALGVIRSAVEAGKKIHVYIDETRPFLQGARLTVLGNDAGENPPYPDCRRCRG